MPRPSEREEPLEVIEQPPEEEQSRIKTPWSFERSIFKDYKADNEELLRECFEFDWSCMRKPKFESYHEESKIKDLLWSAYEIVKNIYRPYSALGMINGIYSISLNTYTELVREVLNLVDGETLKLNDIDMLFIVVNAVRKGDFNPPNGLIRYQFLEILLRIALKKYHISSLYSSQSEAVSGLINTHLLCLKD